MIKPILLNLICFLWLSSSLFALPTSSKLSALYKSLDPFSLSMQMAFFELYPDTNEGKSALNKTFELLGASSALQTKFLPSKSLNSFPTSIIALINKTPQETSLILSEEELQFVESLSSTLSNRKLKGYHVTKEDEVLALEDNQVDLARGLLLSQLVDEEEKINKIRQYEAVLDLMALQILAKLKPKGGVKASSENKIEAINNFIFNELHFRFPPHSTYAPDIDEYTFLPSVLDSRRGVCLGVSILYLALSQRLDLSLEVITPPGHIFVRYKSPKGNIINIETTARGANLPSETYLSVTTKTLQTKTIKETIGLAHQNQASVYSQQKKFDKAVDSYRIACKYLKEDPLIRELLGYHLIFLGEESEGKQILLTIKDTPSDGNIMPDNIASDYLLGLVDAEGIQAVFQHVNDTMESILAKKERIEQTLVKYPRFRSGIAQLATAYLQLRKPAIALKLLERFHEIDNQDPLIEYYLSVLYFERFDWNKSWQSYKNVEALTKAHDHYPKALKEIKQALEKTAPN